MPSAANLVCASRKNNLHGNCSRHRDSRSPRTAAALGRRRICMGEKMVLNMGPSHPATHGGLCIVLEMDGELITKAEPDVGFLHRGDEKIAENMTYTQFIPTRDRLNISPRFALTTSPSMRSRSKNCSASTTKLSLRCQYIRVMRGRTLAYFRPLARSGRVRDGHGRRYGLPVDVHRT